MIDGRNTHTLVERAERTAQQKEISRGTLEFTLDGRKKGEKEGGRDGGREIGRERETEGNRERKVGGVLNRG